MEALFIFMVLLVSSMSYNYDDDERTDYRPRVGLHRLNRIPHSKSPFGRPRFSKPPFGITQYRRTPFGKPLFGTTQYGSTPFGRPLFDTTPFGRPPFRKRFQPPQLYRSNYLRDKSAYEYIATSYKLLLRQTKKRPAGEPLHPDPSLSVFRVLNNEQFNATLVEDKSKYPWIARVVHAPEHAGPMICSAACIEDRIFVTTARCIFNAKVFYTRVYYQDEKLQPLAFVLPSKPTKNMFDDIGLIVVNSNFSKPWKSVEKFESWFWPKTRTDNVTMWFKRAADGRVVGYISDEHLEDDNNVRRNKNTTEFPLYELEVNISPWHCNYIFNKAPPLAASFFVPCYHACNVDSFYNNHSNCYPYLFGEGHIVISEDHKIYGAASWGGRYAKDKRILNPPLPIGFATMNSLALKEDLACAQKIKAAPESSDRFDKFCEKKLINII